MELHILFRNEEHLKKYNETITSFKKFVLVKEVSLNHINTQWYRNFLGSDQIKLPLAVLFTKGGTNRSLNLEKFVHLDDLATLVPLIMTKVSKRAQRTFDRNTYTTSRKYVVPHNANVALKPQSTLWQT